MDNNITNYSAHIFSDEKIDLNSNIILDYSINYKEIAGCNQTIKDYEVR